MLTLFDRETNKVLNKYAIELYEKIKEVFFILAVYVNFKILRIMFINVKVIFLFQHGDFEIFSDDLNVLFDRKFVIKIEVNNYNIKNSCFVYHISNLTDDENILNNLIFLNYLVYYTGSNLVILIN